MRRVLVLLLFTAVISQAEVSFRTTPLDETLKQAGAQQQGVMIDFYTDWCYWCKVMDGKTFSDAGVGTYANSKFAAIRLNAEKGEGVSVSEKYGVHGYPTVLFLDAEGHELYRVVGWESPEKFLRSMSIAAMGTTAQLEENLRTHPDDPQVMYALAQKYARGGDVDRAMDYYRKVVTLDEGNRKQLAEQAALAVAQFESSKDNSALEAYVRDYPNAHAVKEVSYDLALRFIKAGNGGNGQKYFDIAVESGQASADMLNGYAWECAQHKVNLLKALQFAQRAVSMANGPVQQATYLDTQAEVLNAQGNRAEAAKCERDALALLTGEGRDEKLLTQLQKRLTAFEEPSR